MIDSHCHIGLDQADVTDVLERAKTAGITRILSVACSLADYEKLIPLLETQPMIDGAFGIHPENADKIPDDEMFVHLLFAHKRLLAVGECGLDYHYMVCDKTTQQRAFEHQIELANRVQKPLIIHTREADEDTIAILDTASRAGILKNGGVLHCFTGTQKLAEKALDIGFYISASGVITFNSANDIRDVFKTVPLPRLLIETDSPYMAPAPFRGRTNEPAFVLYTARKLAELKSVSEQEIIDITTKNYYHLFGGINYAG